MDGATLRAGAVACVNHVRRPVRAARAVMEHSAHVLLVGAGAEAFAREQGLEMVSPDYFSTEARREQLRRALATDAAVLDHDGAALVFRTPAPGAAPLDEGRKFGTVGAVALDAHGNLAAATSTGGMQFFSVQLGWLPTVGADSWRHYILPSLTLGAGVAAVMARFTRSSFIDILKEDYVRTARAKGLTETVVVVKHALRNALIPVVTMMGLQFGFLLGGSIVVEVVFNWPGMGRLLVDAVEMRDYPVIQALVLLFSLEFILINLVVDVLYGYINPTIRYK